MNVEDAATVKALLSKPQKIVIVPHKNPDGDAIGASLGLQLFLKSMGLDAQVIAPNDYPKFLKWMPGSQEVINFERQQHTAEKMIREAGLVFTLDFNDLSRAGSMHESLLETEADFVMIDHHQQPDDYALVTYSDVTMSSTCEMVYNFIAVFEGTAKITADIATCLYTGIMTDTGSFKYPSTTSDTHRAVADLIDKGAQNMTIHQQVYDTNRPSRLHLLGSALGNLKILAEYHTAYTWLTQAELNKFAYSKGDTEGFVNYGLTLDGINFAVIFIENEEEGIIKISFRSIGGFSVNEFARKHFSGGGHTNAAGGRSTESMERTITEFTSLLSGYKNELDY